MNQLASSVTITTVTQHVFRAVSVGRINRVGFCETGRQESRFWIWCLYCRTPLTEGTTACYDVLYEYRTVFFISLSYRNGFVMPLSPLRSVPEHRARATGAASAAGPSCFKGSSTLSEAVLLFLPLAMSAINVSIERARNRA